MKDPKVLSSCFIRVQVIATRKQSYIPKRLDSIDSECGRRTHGDHPAASRYAACRAYACLSNDAKKTAEQWYSVPKYWLSSAVPCCYQVSQSMFAIKSVVLMLLGRSYACTGSHISICCEVSHSYMHATTSTISLCTP